MYTPFFVFICALCLVSVPAAAQRGEIERLEIAYTGASPWHKSRETATITRTVRGMYEMAFQQGRSGSILEEPVLEDAKLAPVSREAIDALAQALAEPPWPRSQFISQLVTPAWLQANAERVYPSGDPETPRCSADARTLFLSHFLNPAEASAALVGYFESRWTDDWPIADLTIQRTGVPPLVLKTGAQHDTMLPWRRGKVEHWNPAVSQALAAMLPTDSALRKRLSGDLLKRITERVMRSIGRDWEDLEMRCVHRDVVAILEPAFDIARLYGTNSGSFAGYVRRADMPANFAVNIRFGLEQKNAGPEKARQFLAHVGPLISRALTFVRAHPEIRFTLTHADGVSFSEADLRSGPSPDNPKLTSAVAAVANSVGLLREHDYLYGRQWIVLPTGDVHLWQERPEWDEPRHEQDW